MECREPGTTAVRVERRGTSVRLACGCGHFVLSFHSLGVVRKGRFRCPICGGAVWLSRLDALREICRTSSNEAAGGPARECASS
jgi:hypothetical protein